MNLFKRKCKEKCTKVPEEFFREYADTELSPDEIHLMSERLNGFELAGLEPDEVMKLAERDKVRIGNVINGLVFCPVCEELLCTEKFSERHNFCNVCGQRVNRGEEVTGTHWLEEDSSALPGMTSKDDGQKNICVEAIGKKEDE